MTDGPEVALESLGDDIYRIRLSRPERLNALGVGTVQALSACVADASARHARVLLVQGTGRAFSAGADLKERSDMDLAGKLAHNAGIRAAIDSLGAAHCVTVAVINGLALGGGTELALACDMRIAAAGVSLGLTESRIGAFPGAGGTQRLPRLVGVSRALRLMLTGEPVTSEYAQSIGLVDDVVAADALDAHVDSVARLLASRSATALATIKRLVYQGIELPLAAALQVERAALPEILNSIDYAEGLAAFAEKRQPRFTGVVR
ncbi:short chain enoyl-CoA hydratase [Variovorax sp. YR266]|uniref:enoyl-CoA hydratase/isomerase family protein n=1 Tax=Variovorax sp. YR266 TaxID=1884386 RepID=UPI0008991F13|nr:enoyl-CoA hydratase-related protein [Variovorax sp. YR266]SDZ70844.1 short chain enoyl-CoA hydratase [Variovorax sp. YR266]